MVESFQVLSEVLEKNAVRFSEKPCFIYKTENLWKEITYSEFREKVLNFSSSLAKIGVQEKDKIAIIGENSPFWMISYFAIVYCGAIVVPIDKELKADEIGYILSDSSTKFVISSKRCEKEVGKVFPKEKILIMDEKGGFLKNEKFISPDRLSISGLPKKTSPEDILELIYTSGTTGKPKGVMLTHKNIISNISSVIIAADIDESIRTFSMLPISHTYECTCGVLTPIYLGGTVIFCESLKKFVENILETKPNFVLGVPLLYQKFAKRIRKEIEGKLFLKVLLEIPYLNSFIKRAFRKKMGKGVKFYSGGAPLDPSVAKFLRKVGLEIYNGYGITETSPVISLEKKGMVRDGSCGKPIPGVSVKIKDPGEDGVGEILVKGDNVMKGYFNNEEATKEVLKNGWYHTGDLGFIDEDGFLYVKGRIKNLIVTPNGKNVYPEEIEDRLLKSDFIEEAVVYGKKEVGGEKVCALVYPNMENVKNYLGKGNVKREEIISIIEREIKKISRGMADFKRIKEFDIVDEEFPKTATRKIKKYLISRLT